MTCPNVLPIPAFQDNYIWLLYDNATRDAWAVDPGDAAPVINALQKHALHLKGILITHHHRDHSGGVAELAERYQPVPVFGSDLSPLTSITHPLKEGDSIDCGFLSLNVLEIPGHTLDHIAFYNTEVLFCGDTLFSYGCGRIFEGTAAQMYHSLHKLSQLPENLHLYAGHEYTLANLYFAQQVEPNHLILAEKIQQAKEQRANHLPTLPSSLAVEKQLNPFLRCDQPRIVTAVEAHFHKKLSHPVEVFAHLREWKNAIK